MATGQGILARLKRAKEEAAAERGGALPLIAFYGRDPEQERRRNKFYAEFLGAEAMPKETSEPAIDLPKRRSLLFIDLDDAIAILDVNASPLEFIVSRGEMETKLDEEGMAGVRYHTALRLRDLIGGAQIKGPRSPALESSGGGGSSSINLPGYQLDCMTHIRGVREAMPDRWFYQLLESVVFADNWLDLRPAEGRAATPRKKADRLKTLMALHYALDVAAAQLRYLSWPSLRVRWPSGPPPVPPSVRRRIQGPKA